MEWSKGVIFLMATFWPEGLWTAELYEVSMSFGGDIKRPMPNVPNDTIGALANDILNIVLLTDIEGNLAGPAPILCVAHPDPETFAGAVASTGWRRPSGGRASLIKCAKLSKR